MIVGVIVIVRVSMRVAVIVGMVVWMIVGMRVGVRLLFGCGGCGVNGEARAFDILPGFATDVEMELGVESEFGKFEAEVIFGEAEVAEGGDAHVAADT